MREVNVSEITDVVADLCIKSNVSLPQDVRVSLDEALNKESSNNAKGIIDLLIENYKYAEGKNIAICQDTGMTIIFIKIGQNVKLIGGSLVKAVNAGVKRGYIDGYLRCSVVEDPLYDRKNTGDNTPAIIYTDVVEGSQIEITVAPKGFGSENMSRQIMMTPSASEKDVIDFTIETVKLAGSKACPPMVIGVGIGGDFEYSAYLAKKALCRNINCRNHDLKYKELELKILNEVNNLKIGVQGQGGDTTALAVNVEYYPTHIASLPVAVNIGCHATRHATFVI